MSKLLTWTQPSPISLHLTMAHTMVDPGAPPLVGTPGPMSARPRRARLPRTVSDDRRAERSTNRGSLRARARNLAQHAPDCDAPHPSESSSCRVHSATHHGAVRRRLDYWSRTQPARGFLKGKIVRLNENPCSTLWGATT